MTTPSPLLEVDGIRAAYDRVDVLQGVSLTVAPGSITCILGANGAGKSTLIRAILGLTPPHTGAIRFDGQAIHGLPTHRVIARGIACIPEGRKVFPKMTVEENLAWVLTRSTTRPKWRGASSRPTRCSPV